MDIKYVKEFVILAKAGSFLEAAAVLNSSQSTLSKHIKKLEMELGVNLFDRTTHQVTISKYGQLFLPYANQIIELQEQYSGAINLSLTADRDVLNLGTIPAIAEYDITGVIINFKKNRPHSTINVVQEGSSELKELLRQKICDLAFIRFPDDGDDDLIKIPYTSDTLVAVLPPTHPLANQNVIPLQLLADEDLVLSEKHTMLHRISVNACHQAGFEPKIIYTDHKYENILEFVINGMGVALMMKKLALHFPNPQVAIVGVTPEVTTKINLCYLKNTELTDAAKFFIRCTGSFNRN